MTIAFITTRDTVPTTGRVEGIVDRGYILETGRSVVLPSMTPSELGARWDENSAFG